MTNTIWVLRDLSNGNGAESVKYPTYVWAYRTRHWARERGRIHRANPHTHARLGPVERWPANRLKRLYKDVGGIAAGNYWRHK